MTANFYTWSNCESHNCGIDHLFPANDICTNKSVSGIVTETASVLQLFNKQNHYARPYVNLAPEFRALFGSLEFFHKSEDIDFKVLVHTGSELIQREIQLEDNQAKGGIKTKMLEVYHFEEFDLSQRTVEPQWISVCLGELMTYSIHSQSTSSEDYTNQLLFIISHLERLREFIRTAIVRTRYIDAFFRSMNVKRMEPTFEICWKKMCKNLEIFKSKKKNQEPRSIFDRYYSKERELLFNDNDILTAADQSSFSAQLEETPSMYESGNRYYSKERELFLNENESLTVGNQSSVSTQPEEMSSMYERENRITRKGGKSDRVPGELQQTDEAKMRNTVGKIKNTKEQREVTSAVRPLNHLKVSDGFTVRVQRTRHELKLQHLEKMLCLQKHLEDCISEFILVKRRHLYETLNGFKLGNLSLDTALILGTDRILKSRFRENRCVICFADQQKSIECDCEQSKNLETKLVLERIQSTLGTQQAIKNNDIMFNEIQTQDEPEKKKKKKHRKHSQAMRTERKMSVAAERKGRNVNLWEQFNISRTKYTKAKK